MRVLEHSHSTRGHQNREYKQKEIMFIVKAVKLEPRKYVYFEARVLFNWRSGWYIRDILYKFRVTDNKDFVKIYRETWNLRSKRSRNPPPSPQSVRRTQLLVIPNYLSKDHVIKLHKLIINHVSSFAVDNGRRIPTSFKASETTALTCSHLGNRYI